MWIPFWHTCEGIITMWWICTAVSSQVEASTGVLCCQLGIARDPFCISLIVLLCSPTPLTLIPLRTDNHRWLRCGWPLFYSITKPFTNFPFHKAIDYLKLDMKSKYFLRVQCLLRNPNALLSGRLSWVSPINMFTQHNRVMQSIWGLHVDIVLARLGPMFFFPHHTKFTL